MKGFARPFTPQGRASALVPLPWRFLGIQRMIHFRADPDALNALIPPPLTPNPDRAGEAFLWSPNLFCEPVDQEAAVTIGHPARTNYNVVVIAVPCLFNGEPRLISAFQWGEKDWLVILSWIMGTCAKQAQFFDTGASHLVHETGGAHSGPLDTPYTRSISRNGQELIRLSMTAGEGITAGDMAFYSGNFPLLSERHIPDVCVPPTGRPLVHDLTQMVQGEATTGGYTRGNADLWFNPDADNEELGPLQPVEVLGGYRWYMTFNLEGLKVVHNYLSGA